MRRIVEGGTDGGGGGGGAVMLRVHHTIGDGMSLVGVGLKALRGLDGRSLDADSLGARRGGGGASRGGKRPSLLTLLGKLLRSFVEVLWLPVSAFDRPTPFRRPPEAAGGDVFSGSRRTVAVPTVSLNLVKAIKNKAHATVNDVMVSLIGGAVRRYVADGSAGRGTDGSTKLRARALIPVALPRAAPWGDYDEGLQNKWVFCSIPMSMDEVSMVLLLTSL
ncbi:unnamed protein product, partial [Phaeothamnion confervicola]